MRERKLQYGKNVRVRKGIQNILSLPPRFNHAVVPQNSKLMRNRALIAAHRLDDVINAHLPLSEGEKYL